MKRRVLLVDDNLISRKVMSQVFSSFQVDITEASSGEHAFQLVQKQPFDIILMDVVMPKMNGYEAAALIRESGVLSSNTPIIAVTTDAKDDTVADALMNGMDGAIAKPLKKKAIQALFDNLFGDDNVSLFDIPEFEAFYDDPVFRLEIIDTVMEDKDQDRADLVEAFASGICDTIYKKVHYLKGSFSYLKSQKMVELSQTILNACKENDVKKAVSLRTSYLETFQKFLDELNGYVEVHS